MPNGLPRLAILPMVCLVPLLAGCLATQNATAPGPLAPQTESVSASQLEPVLEPEPVAVPQPVAVSEPATIEALEAEFAAQVPRTERLSIRRELGAYTSDGGYFGKGLSKTLRRGEVVVQIDVSGGAPIYRIIVDEALVQARTQPESRRRLSVAITLTDDNRARLDLPAPAAWIRENDLIVSDWIGCASCFPGMATTPASERELARQATAFAVLQNAARTGRRLEILHIRLGPSLPEPPSLARGRAAALTWAQQRSQVIKADLARRAAARAEYRAYQAFRRGVAPRTLNSQIEQLGCTEKHVRWINSPDNARETLRHNDAFIACRVRALEDYDHEGYARQFPEIAAQEETLAAAAYGVQRPALYTPEEQVRVVTDQIERAEKANDDALYALEYTREQRAEREGSRPRWQRIAEDARARTARIAQEMQIAREAQIEQEVQDAQTVQDAPPIASQSAGADELKAGTERIRADEVARVAVVQAEAQDAEATAQPEATPQTTLESPLPESPPLESPSPEGPSAASESASERTASLEDAPAPPPAPRQETETLAGTIAEETTGENATETATEATEEAETSGEAKTADEPAEGPIEEAAEEPAAPQATERKLYLARRPGTVAERCNPMNAMAEGRFARCQELSTVKHYVVGLARCGSLDTGEAAPAEVTRIATHQLISVQGLTDAEYQRVFQAAARDAPYVAASPSQSGARYEAERGFASLGRRTDGLPRTYYTSAYDMKADLSAKGCDSYELDGERFPTR